MMEEKKALEKFERIFRKIEEIDRILYSLKAENSSLKQQIQQIKNKPEISE